MKIAILSDIHANLQALETVLEDCVKQIKDFIDFRLCGSHFNLFALRKTGQGYFLMDFLIVNVYTKVQTL